MEINLAAIYGPKKTPPKTINADKNIVLGRILICRTAKRLFFLSQKIIKFKTRARKKAAQAERLKVKIRLQIPKTKRTMLKSLKITPSSVNTAKTFDLPFCQMVLCEVKFTTSSFLAEKEMDFSSAK